MLLVLVVISSIFSLNKFFLIQTGEDRTGQDAGEDEGGREKKLIRKKNEGKPI